MKKLFILAVVFASMASLSLAQNVDTKELRKQRTEITKLSKSELNARATKDARKESKRLAKEGWKVAPGGLPLDNQLDKSYLMAYEYDEQMFPKYIKGEAMSIAENYDAGKMQALELAKQNLAGQIQTEITALIENTVANKQLSSEQAASVTESVMSSKNLISQSIGRVVPVVEIYRVLPNKNKEVRVVIAYNSQMAMEVAKKAVRATLEAKGDKLHEQLDNILKLN